MLTNFPIKRDVLWIKPNIFKEADSSLNQSLDYKTRNDCPIFSSLNNLDYNTGFTIWEPPLTIYGVENQIDLLCKAKWLISDDKWGYASCMEIVYDYTRKFNFKEENANRDKIGLIECQTWDMVFNALINLGYAVRVLIGVNPQFFTDGRTYGKLPLTGDHYKGDIHHFINVTSDKVLDNYAGKWAFNNYFVPISEARKFIVGNTCYAFFLNI